VDVLLKIWFQEKRLLFDSTRRRRVFLNFSLLKNIGYWWCATTTLKYAFTEWIAAAASGFLCTLFEAIPEITIRK